MKEQDLELIERHLEDKLSKDERKAFEQQMQTDENFANEVVIYQNLMKGIDASGALSFEEKVKGWEKEMKGAAVTNTINNVSQETPKTATWKYIAIGTGLILLSIVGYFLITSTNDEASIATPEGLYATNFEVYPTTTIVKGQREDKLSVPMTAYSKGDYTTAIKDFEALLSTDDLARSERTVAEFYMGVSELAVNQNEAAIDNFNKVLKAKSLTFQESTEWYLALAYLNNKNHKLANKQLRAITEQPYHSKKDKAAKLLEQMKAYRKHQRSKEKR